MLASRLAREQGADDALLVTPHGRVLECPTVVVLPVRDGEVCTAPLCRARARLDHPPRGAGRDDVREEPIALDELADAQEAFVASSVVRGRRRAPRRRARFEAPGPRTRALAALVREQILAELRLMRIATVVGNRPQFVKAAAVSRRCASATRRC